MDDHTPSTRIMDAASVVSSLRMNDDTDSFENDNSGHLLFADEAPQLNLNNMPLAGRKQEYSLLKASFKRIQKGKHPSEVILISGLSGSGKSKLAESIRKPVTLKRNGFFVSGKFDQQRKEPFSALVEAFTDLCDLISQDKVACQGIAKALEGDLSVLSKLIPNLSSVTGSADQWGVDSHSTSSDSYIRDKAGFTQLKLACRKFLSVVASREHSVVLLLDDLQWADKESIEVIQSIATDLNSKYVLVIGTYRSDEARCLDGLVDTLENKVGGLLFTSIHLGNLSPKDVASLIAQCTDRPSSETRDLADLVIKRTDGSPLFVLQFIEMLEREDLLEYDGETRQWLWSVEHIQGETIACDNVVEIVKARIHSLQLSVQAVLRLAAVLGFTFDKGVVKAAMWERRTPKQTEVSHIHAQVNRSLKVAEDRGLVECNVDGTFRFSHDSISACLYSMTPAGIQLASVHLLFAEVMEKMSNDSTNYVFAIAEQLNRAKLLIETDADRLKCAQFNLRAAKQALDQSAYDFASEYTQLGLDIMNTPRKWEACNYSTVLDLHCVAAEALYCCGDLDGTNQNLQQVFQHAQSLRDITRARTIHVYSLGAKGNLEEATDAAFHAARELGIDIPRNPSMCNAIWLLIKTKAMLNGKSDEELLALPTVENEGMKDVFNLVAIAAHYSSISLRIPHLILAISTLVQLSVKRNYSFSTSFSLFGILETVMGNVPNAVRMARLTSKMHESSHNTRAIPGDLCVLHTFLVHWRAPLLDSLEPLQQSYVTAMETGIFDLAFSAVVSWTMVATFCGGYPLAQVETYTRRYVRQMQEYKHMNPLYLTLPYWQFCMNLMGQSDDPAVLSGEAMDEKRYTEEATNAKVLTAPQALNSVRIILVCHFDATCLMQALMTEYESYPKAPVGHFMSCQSKFYNGLAYIKLYRNFQNRSHKRKARKIVTELRKWTLDGCPNTQVLWVLLDAELSTIARRQDASRVGKLFLHAIQHASTSRNVCLEALANEGAARYYHTQVGDETKALLFTERAIDLYTSYGALAKVNFMERRRDRLSSKSKCPAPPLEILPKESSVTYYAATSPRTKCVQQT